MDDLKTHYRQGLPTRIEALESAKRTLPENAAEAIESIRRIAHSLRGSGATYGFPEISRTAEALEEASEKQLPKRLDELLAVLRETLAGGDAPKAGILIIEDDFDIVHIFQIKLSAPNRAIFVAETAADAEKILEEKQISLILLDLVLPDTDGRALLVRLRKHPRTATTPIFVVSGGVGAQPKTECLALGADEYFEKPFNPQTIAAAISAKLQELTEKTREAGKDALTELPNRAAVSQIFEEIRAGSSQKEAPLSLGIVDVDHFELLKETFGQGVGKKVLQAVASIVSKVLRESDLLTRWGEQEFIVLFPNTDRNQAKDLLDKALEDLRNKRYRTKDSKTFQVTFSASVVEISAGVSLEDAVAEADRLIYQAKIAGRNRVVLAEHETALAKKRILLAEDDELVASIVKHRLGRDGFDVVHFADGASALSSAQESPPSLAIVDVKMPVMDGFELLKNLREDESMAKVPIVMLTAMGSERDVTRGFELGADDYIPKPFSPVELLARIHRLLRKQ
ncbi:MAG: response regulator [bacterium]